MVSFGQSILKKEFKLTDPLFVHAVCVAQVGAASLEAYLLELFAYFVEDHVELGAWLIESHKGV